MTARKLPIRWRAIIRVVAIVYGTTFVSGLALAFAGITPQTHSVGYPLLALFTGITLILGRLLLGTSLDRPAPAASYSSLVHRVTQAHRNH